MFFSLLLSPTPLLFHSSVTVSAGDLLTGSSGTPPLCSTRYWLLLLRLFVWDPPQLVPKESLLALCWGEGWVTPGRPQGLYLVPGINLCKTKTPELAFSGPSTGFWKSVKEDSCEFSPYKRKVKARGRTA